MSHPPERRKKRKEECKKNGAKSQRAGKQEIHIIAELARQAMKLAKKVKKKEGEELNNFDDLHNQNERCLKGRLV